ncbi:TonB-dependent receptor [Psychroflexus sp. CCL10W]|nr:TonB-dependent receptor [Psychroflexus montanilacus]
MVKNFLIATLCLLSMWVYSQEKDIEGSVVDKESGTPLLGVNVVVEGTSQGTTTDFDGNFALSDVPNDATLVFSYLGFQTLKLNVAEAKGFEIQLVSDTEALDDVVVIGYGSSSKRNITGAVTKLDSQKIEKLDPVNAGTALQGTIAGVNALQTGGSPGADVNIRIRGVGTNGDNKPLIILDGFQYEGPLNSINPNDIESFTVLKDAQASIYGSAGSNGVVLITTKQGKKNQKAKIKYDAYYGVQETTRELPLLNATEYALLLNESYTNSGQVSPIQNFNNLGAGTDWQGAVFEQAPVMSHNISAEGGGEKVTYSISGSHLDQDGIVGGSKSGFQRSTAKLSLNADLRDNLTVSTSVFFNHTKRNLLNDFGLGSVLFNAINISPTIDQSVDDLTGQIDLGNEVINPLTQIDNTFNQVINNRLSGTFQIDYDYAKNLNLTARIGFNSSTVRGRQFLPAFNFGPNRVFNRDESQINQNINYNNDYTFDLFNTYKNTFDDVHGVTFLLGTTAYREYGQGLSGSNVGIPNNNPNFGDLGQAIGSGDQETNTSFTFDFRRISYFGRLEYDFDNKYLLSAILRFDSSSSFGPNNSTAVFPSFSGGWVVTEEDWFDYPETIDYFKIRSSYGVLGNDRIPTFGYLSLLNGEATYVSSEDGSLIQGQALGQLPNPNLKWEEARKFNIGFDTSLWNNKFNITLDYYRNIREDLLIPGIPVSGIFGTFAPGASSPTINAGTVRNKGIEFSVDYSESFSDDFTLSAGFNVATVSNEVKRVSGAAFLEGGEFGVGQPAPSRMQEGLPLGYFYGYQTDGIFQSQAEADAHPDQQALGGVARAGDIRYLDLNDDGVIDENDRTNLGNPIPDVTMGLNLTMNYKNLDFSVYGFSNLGQEMVRNYERDQPNVNQLNYRLNRWTGPGTSNTVPRVTTQGTSNNAFSDFFVEDASFARIQTLSLGYTFPKSVYEKSGLSNLRIYGKVDNVVTFTEYRGYDPTASTGAPIGGGIDLGFYPLPRTFMLGVNVEL